MQILLGKFIVLFVILFSGTQMLVAGNRYALVVGINKYPKAQQLDGPINDATAFATFLGDKNFTEIKILTDEKATRAEIFRYFKHFQDKVKPGDLFIFYFAGHGTVFLDSRSEVRDEILNIVGDKNPNTNKPIFPPGKYDSAICPFDHKETTSNKKWGNIILDDELFEEFSKFIAKGSGVLLVADSCNSGTLGRTLGSPKTRFLAPEEAYDTPKEEKQDPSKPKIFVITTIDKKLNLLSGKFLALTAAADRQNAEEFEDNKRKSWGIFTYYLLEVLRENPNITIDALRKEIDNRAARKNPRQKVQIDSRFFNFDVGKTKFLFPF